MADIEELRKTAKALHAWARQIRLDNEKVPYPTSREDAGLLEMAANGMESAANEIEHLRKGNYAH
jgi:hypothetical protein